MWIDASAHYHQLLRQGGKLGIEEYRARDVCHGTSRVNRDLVWVLVNHAAHKMCDIFGRGFVSWVALAQIRDLVGIVCRERICPGSLVENLAIGLLPKFGPFLGPNDGSAHAGNHRYFSASH